MRTEAQKGDEMWVKSRDMLVFQPGLELRLIPNPVFFHYTIQSPLQIIFLEILENL